MSSNLTKIPLENPKRKSRNIWLDGMERLSRNKAAVLSSLFIIFLIIVAIFADVIAPYSPYETDFSNVLSTPTKMHLLGTDEIGRDLLSRLIFGTRLSLYVGLTVQIFSIFIGVSLVCFLVITAVFWI